MKTEYNTDEHSLDRIYKRVTFSTLSLDRPDNISKKQAILDFIKRADKLATQKNIVCYDIAFDYDEGDHDNLPSFGLCAEGYRLETDEEYINRLKWKLSHLKTGYDGWKMKQSYYDKSTPEGFHAKWEKLSDVISKLENAEDCH